MLLMLPGFALRNPGDAKPVPEMLLFLPAVICGVGGRDILPPEGRSIVLSPERRQDKHQ